MTTPHDLDRKQFFQPVVETISLTLKLPACIWLVDETEEALRIAAATGLSDDYMHNAVLCLGELSIASEVFATGQTIVVTDITTDDRWKYKREAAAMGLKSAMVVPLRVKKKIVGVLDVYTHQLRDFSDSEKALIESFATQVAITQRRIRDLTTLNEVSLLISSELYSADLFKRIMQAAERVLDCKHVSVFLTDKSGDLVLEAASSAGIARQHFAQGVGLAGWVTQTKRSELVPDAVKHPRFVSGLSSDLVERSMVLTPIILEDKVIGVISADMDELSGFDEHDQMLLEALASQAAVAVRNTQLFEEATSRAAVLQRLQQIGGRILSAELSAQGLREVLRQVARSARSVLGADLVDVYEYIEADNRYILPPILEGERRDPFVPKDQIFDDDVIVRVIKGREPIYNPDAQTEPLLTGLFTVERLHRPDKRFVVREGILSSAAIPLKAAGKTVGAMFVNYRVRQAFTREQRGAIELFANQAAMAIYNARVYEQARGRIEALEALNEVGQTLTSGIRLKEEKVLELTHTQAGQLMDTDNMYIALYDEATDTVRFGLAFVNGKRIDVKKEKGWQPRRAGKGKTEYIIRNRKSLFHPTGEEGRKWYAEPGHEEYIGAPELASWLGVPMMVGERVLGVIATYHPTRDYVYSEDDLTILQAMGHQAAIALDNAHMFYDVNQRLEALVKFGQVVTSGIRLSEDEVLELIYSQASKLMDTGNMYIALYDESTDTVRFGLAMVEGSPIDVQPRKAGKGRTEEIIRTKKPIFLATEAEAENWYDKPGREDYLIREMLPSWLGVPMMVGEKVLGVIATYHPTRDYVYSSDDLEILQAMAEVAAIALDNARLYAETRRLQDEVVATQQLATLGTAIAALQHRINNTFNIIVPNVTRLRKRVDMTNETIAEILDIIERNARYTSDIIARIQDPLREVEAQDVDVNAVLTDVVGRVSEQWREDPTRPTIEDRLDLDASLPRIRAPIGQIAEVFYNLVDNAYRAMKAGGQLVVTSRLTDSEIRVRVQDTGPGIPPQVQQRLFVKPVPSKEPSGGAGLGLWLSRLMLQSIGGDVIIEKTDPTGTTMLVQIPAPGAGRKV